MKKVFAILLALTMLLAMAAPAMAEGTGSITITNTTNDREYTAYKIFDLDITSGTYTYTIKSDSEWYSVIDGYDGITLTQISGEGTTPIEYRVDQSATFDVDALAALIGANLEGKTPDKEVTATDGNQAVIDGLEYGYYYVTSSLGSLVILDSTTTSIADKNDDPKIEKTASAGSANVAIGDEIEYTITITATGAADTSYVVHDNMSDGLTLVSNSVAVKLNDTALTADTDYTLNLTPTHANGDPCTFEVTFDVSFTENLEKDDKIVITYKAKVNENAVAGEAENNTAKLVFGDATSVDANTTHTTSEFDLVKTRSDNSVLSGAKFKLYKQNGETADKDTDTLIRLVDEGDGYYRVALPDEASTDDGTIVVTDEIEAGVANVTGLDEDCTYYLVETTAPTGFNPVNGTITVNFSTATTEENEDDGIVYYVSGGIQVVNLAGSELPATGGIGTTIFYVVGGLLMAAAVVLLVTKKKVASGK